MWPRISTRMESPPDDTIPANFRIHRHTCVKVQDLRFHLALAWPRTLTHVKPIRTETTARKPLGTKAAIRATPTRCSRSSRRRSSSKQGKRAASYGHARCVYGFHYQARASACRHHGGGTTSELPDCCGIEARGRAKRQRRAEPACSAR